jgi:hypothetical protein
LFLGFSFLFCETQEQFDCEVFAMRWLRTLFAQQFDFDFVFRIWDIIFVEGLDFALKMILALFLHSQGTDRIWNAVSVFTIAEVSHSSTLFS